MKKQNLIFILPILFLTGYLFAILYATVIAGLNNGFRTKVTWIWKFQFTNSYIYHSMIQGILLYLVIIIVYFGIIILEEVKSNK